MSAAKRTRSGLCCGCGNLKTLSVNYNRGESFQEAGHGPYPDEIVRCTFTAKCHVCGEWTRHAKLRQAILASPGDALDLDGPGPDLAERLQAYALGGPADHMQVDGMYHEELFARYHVERLCDPVRRELAGANEFGPVSGAEL